MIRQVHGKYVLFNKEGSKILGHHPTKEAAEKQEIAINLSKARAAGDKVPPPLKKAK
jgi:UDP-N-acetylmuramyl tripeptide synthase